MYVRELVGTQERLAWLTEPVESQSAREGDSGSTGVDARSNDQRGTKLIKRSCKTKADSSGEGVMGWEPSRCFRSLGGQDAGSRALYALADGSQGVGPRIGPLLLVHRGLAVDCVW